MPRFFIDGTHAEGSIIVIVGEDALHISKSLRMRIGESIILCNQQGTDYNCELVSVEKDVVQAVVVSAQQTESEPLIKVTLFMSVIKGEKMDFLIQKAVELGVGTIVPVITKRCVSKPDPKSEKNKLIRWNKIALEASKQSGRGTIPKVEAFMSFEEAVKSAVEAELPMIAYEKSDTHFKDILNSKSFRTASLIVGPEGGLEEDEVTLATDAGIKIISLGKRILRAETAPLCALSIIHYHNS